jgi:uncharacterized protein (TIGR02246 family)
MAATGETEPQAIARIATANSPIHARRKTSIPLLTQIRSGRQWPEAAEADARLPHLAMIESGWNSARGQRASRLGKTMSRPGSLLFFALAIAGASAAPAQSANDRLALGQLPELFSRAWAHHDGHELAQLMSRDVDFVNVGAIWLHGADFETYHSRILAGRFRRSTNTPLATDVRFIRPGIAVVRWSWRIDGELLPDDRPAPTRFGLMTMIAEKRGGHWLITNAQNTNSGPHRPEADGLSAPIVAPRAP